jgi:hypothetical protein
MLGRISVVPDAEEPLRYGVATAIADATGTSGVRAARASRSRMQVSGPSTYEAAAPAMVSPI